MYHMKQQWPHVMQLPVPERRWYVDRFIEQKEKEHKAAERARQKKR